MAEDRKHRTVVGKRTGGDALLVCTRRTCRVNLPLLKRSLCSPSSSISNLPSALNMYESIPFILDKVKDLIYGLSEPPPQVRTKPLQVICAGPSRSATESLAIALQKLGIETFHGWKIYVEGVHCQQLCKLGRKKFRGPPDGEHHITAADFDKIFGEAEAVVDTPATFACAELIEAFPDAKVILNTRRDLDAWHRSIVKTIASRDQSWMLWLLCRFNSEMFWMWDMTHNFWMPGMYHSQWPATTTNGLLYCGKWVYRDHCNMVRGMVPKEQLLEWTVEDGWEPLCDVSLAFE